MKKYLSILLFTMASCFAFSGNGSGTEDAPFIITTVDELQEMKDNLTAHYRLGNDIDASETEEWNVGRHDFDDLTPDSAMGFEPVGTRDAPFEGSLNGAGFEIEAVYMNRCATSRTGIIGYADSGATIDSLGIVDVHIVSRDCSGGVVGLNYGSVSNCYVTGSVSSKVSSTIGGVVGENFGLVSNCYATASVSTGDDRVAGGVVGRNNGTVTHSYFTGSVSGDSHTGGVVASNHGLVTHCYNTGLVSGSLIAGGVAGRNFEDGIVRNSYSTGPVEGHSSIGGVVGNNEGVVANCYATGSVSGDKAGGIVGDNDRYASIRNCYTTSTVSGSNFVGPVVGTSWSSMGDSIINCFFNLETFGADVDNRIDAGVDKWCKSVKGKTPTELKTESNFTEVDWDFDSTWEIDGNNYPFLQWESEQTTAIKDFEYHSKSGLSLTNNSITLSENSPYTISIFSVNGRLLRYINSTELTLQLNTLNLANGIYQMRVVQGSDVFTGQFMLK